MGAQNTPSPGKMMVILGAMDVLAGLGMAVAGMTGMVGPDMELLAIVGALIAIVGMGMVLYGRHKLSQADDRHGDLN